MEMQAIVRLVGSGNMRDVEQIWMSVIERADVDSDRVLELAPILDELIKNEKRDQAGSLAWAAIETLKEKRPASDALRAAKPILLRLSKSDDLKRITAELFRETYADREHIEELLDEAGIAGGRPPRRAIRTLDVCLAIEPGSFVVSRDDDQATRVESINMPNWEVTFQSDDGLETLGPVLFADRFATCDDQDYRVLARFDRERLQSLLKKDPAAVVRNILHTRGRRLDGEELREIMTPGMIPAADWSKWWTRARTAIKKSREIKLEGRSPCVLEFIPGGHEIQEEFVRHVIKLESPAEQLAAFDEFVRELKARHESPDAATLKKVRDTLAERAKRLETAHATPALAEWLVEARIAGAVGCEDPDRDAVQVLRESDDPRPMIRACESPQLWRCACQCIEKARPDDWAHVLRDVLPSAPSAACEDIADLLEKSSLPQEAIDQTVKLIVSQAVDCFGALCWLWEKGLDRERWRSVPPVTVFTRVLTLMATVQRSDKIPAPLGKRICAVVRPALAARKYERFQTCLTTVEQGMGAALKTQIQRLDNLGPRIHDDLLNRIQERFPELHKKAEIPLWAEENTLYATVDGIRRWEAEIKQLVNVKMKDNARAIGDAAEKGDLSENSEYKSALEERDLLRARYANMREQLAMVRRLVPEDVPTDHATVGSKVTLRHVDSGREVEMTFLGPLDADTERGIYNYKAPLAQDIMGLSVGDTVELSTLDVPGAYEIITLAVWTD